MIGTILSDRYIIREIVGTGGMSVVYRAWDKQENREVAIKVLRPEYVEDAEFIRRFDNEALAASKMSHPNIVAMYDVGQDGDVRYLAMEYIEGRTLKDLIRQTGHIKTTKAVQLTLRILAAVDHAHRNHFVHRDIKPQNILVDNASNVKVADFGIARTLNTTTMTFDDSGSVIGSVHYFSPEQASGKGADEKSDLYSVGVVLYEMLTGSVPFDGETPVSVALKHVQETPKSAQLLEPEVSAGLDEVLKKAMAKDPANRYQTAADMANDLKRALRMPEGGFVELSDEEEETEKPEDIIKTDRRKKLRFRIKLLVFAILFAGAVVGGFALVGLYQDMFTKIQAPDVTLKYLEDAVEELKAQGISPVIIKQNHPDIGVGFVISQTPDAGKLIWPSDKITIVVSDGKASVEMPDYAGFSRNEATDAMREIGLVLDGVQYEVSTAYPGEVIGQEPAAGESVHAGDKVRLHVSGESALVPSVVGYTLSEGGEALKKNGFPLGTVTEKLSDKPVGTIISQSIAEGEIALIGTPINVTVSQEQPTTYRALEDVTITVPRSGGIIRCTLEEGTEGEREFYAAEHTSGKQKLHLDMDSFAKGEHKLRVYLNDKLKVEKKVNFE